MSTRVLSLFALLVTISAGHCSPAGSNDLSAFESSNPAKPETQIDQLVFARLAKLNLQPAHRSSDAVFLRRVYLDVIGTVPPAQVVTNFLADRNPNKRRALIDRLLSSDLFAEYWTMKWSELLRVKAEFPINLWPNAAEQYHHWIRTQLKQNVPYDRFAWELLTSSGSNFRVGPVNFYRALQSKDPQTIAKAVALTFMGSRAENWPAAQLSGMAAFFSRIGYKPTAEWKEEIVFFDSMAATNRAAEPAAFPDGTLARLQPEQDPREVFAVWLIDPKNPWFSRNIANRIWSWLLGRGIIHEPDDIRPDNPPSQPELLGYLEQELIQAHFDLKHLFRIILNSTTYQLSSIRPANQTQAPGLFAVYPLRRLPAEVLIDALNEITGTTENYSSAIPEPYTFIPAGQRSIDLPDGSISSSFLEMFGRPPRDTGLESERNDTPSADQRLHLLNSSHIQRKLQQSAKLDRLLVPSKNPRQIITGLYLSVLSRFPTDTECGVAEAYLQSASMSRHEAALDIAWALVNSAEFAYRH